MGNVWKRKRQLSVIEKKEDSALIENLLKRRDMNSIEKERKLEKKRIAYWKNEVTIYAQILLWETYDYSIF